MELFRFRRQTLPFNEARALCAGSCDVVVMDDFRNIPSMRPAHYAREVVLRSAPTRFPSLPFNEARALCAGSCYTVPSVGAARFPFNEARALCAGSSPIFSALPGSCITFNEARALCAGSLP